MDSQDLVQAYMEIQSQTEQEADVPDLSDSEVYSIKQQFGGEEAYDQMTTWAANNLDPNTVQAFDDLVQSGSIDAINLAVSGLKAQYDNANGYEGRMVSGKAPVDRADAFRSQAELVAAMSDPRYENDPAYRQDVITKLDRSDNLQF